MYVYIINDVINLSIAIFMRTLDSQVINYNAFISKVNRGPVRGRHGMLGVFFLTHNFAVS
jgi:hypothetical protein